ncbi:uracil-DNA glycosylase [Gottschalkiaceae bacterium SANA]|nr:uracil-DNA glycosylase [Gottschalkiaceae bacterium SANA]
MNLQINNDWQELLSPEFEKPTFQNLMDFLDAEYASQTIYPPADHVFNALNCTPYKDVKAVIIGQDPYHGPNQAHGLCFSVQPGIKIPPSLANIYKELKSDLGIPIPEHGYLENWAKQGVLMINAVLTVRDGNAGSHAKMGWEPFTDKIIEHLNARKKPLVFILWGGYARKKAKMISNPIHLVLEAPHPSPLSSYRGFFGSKPFSKTNEFLIQTGQKPIEWSV